MGRRYLFFGFIYCLFFCYSPQAISQEKCGAVLLEEKYRSIVGESVGQFEHWVAQRRGERQLRLANSRTVETVYTIPVVVHVLHQGEAYGEDSNIPIEQVYSQIDILNRDFRRLNADTTETRGIFKPVAADTKIEFVLAKRDPEGLPTNGVVRVRAGRDSYGIGDEELLKEISYWPADQYMNLWVTNLRSGLLGFAQFPVSDLAGLETNTGNKLLADGVTIDYQYFGEGYNAVEFSRGRTATHEVGHFLGLRHIWGDGGCSTDDYCADTPAQDSSASSAACQLTKTSCGNTNMIENYMDYSPDRCMNIFTSDQRERMRTVLEYSPRRRSLLSSAAAAAPVMVATDVGIKEVVNPQSGICNARFTPEIILRNYGLNAVSQVEVRMTINGEEWQTKNVAVSLPSLAMQTVTFDEVLLQQGGLYATAFEITGVDGAGDDNTGNDYRLVQASYQRLIALPFLDNIEGTTLQLVSKPDDPATPFASLAAAPKELAGNRAVKFGFFGADSTAFGAWEMLLTPIIDLTKYPSLTINFDYAYGHDGVNNADGLMVVVSTDCGATFHYDDIVFKRFGEGLATAYIEPGVEFVPAGPAEWKKGQISINTFRGASRIQLAFIAQNGLGNNLYLDDIRISSNSLADYDIGISEVLDLPFVSCINEPAPSVEVKNFGKQAITHFTVYYTVGDATDQVNVSNIFLSTGQSMEVPLRLPALADGAYRLEVTLDSPNGNADQRTSDNAVSQLFHIRSATDVLPLREVFASARLPEEDVLQRIINDDGRTWQIQNDESLAPGNKVARMTSYDLTALGDEFWMVTRVLDLGEAAEASMSFKVSYAKRGNRSERLRVMVSTNCGINFQDVVYDKRGSDLAVTESDKFWQPASADDWTTESVDLSAYAGLRNVVVALVGTNGNGNNLYIDNVEFYLSARPTPEFPAANIIRVFPNPAKEVLNVAFSLPERQTVLVRLQDVRGRIYFEKEYPQTLNQVYELITINENNGLYIVHVITSQGAAAQRVIIRH